MQTGSGGWGVCEFPVVIRIRWHRPTCGFPRILASGGMKFRRGTGKRGAGDGMVPKTVAPEIRGRLTNDPSARRREIRESFGTPIVIMSDQLELDFLSACTPFVLH